MQGLAWAPQVQLARAGMRCGGGEFDGFARSWRAGRRIRPWKSRCGSYGARRRSSDRRAAAGWPSLAAEAGAAYGQDDVWVPFQHDPCPYRPFLAGLLGISSPWPGEPSSKERLVRRLAADAAPSGPA